MSTPDNKLLQAADLQGVGLLLEDLHDNGKIDGVGFDLYETLIRTKEGWGDISARTAAKAVVVFEQAGIPVDLTTYNTHAKAVMAECKARRDELLEETPLPTAYRRITDALLNTQGVQLDDPARNELAKTLCTAETSILVSAMVAYEDAPAMLGRIHDRGLPIGIYSNTPASKDVVVEIAHNTGLTEFIPESNIFSSADTGIVKPDRRAVVMLAAQMHVTPQRTAYVGDRQTDVLAATHAGAIPILKSRPRS